MTPVYSQRVSVGQEQLITTMPLQESGFLLSKGQVPIANWHSHPNLPGYGGEYLSPTDYAAANSGNQNTYLLTPTGWVLNYQGSQNANLTKYGNEVFSTLPLSSTNINDTTQVSIAAKAATPVGWFDSLGHYYDVVPLPKGQYGPLQVKPRSSGY